MSYLDKLHRAPLQVEAEVGLVGADEVGRGVDDGPVERQQRLVPLQGVNRQQFGLRIEAKAQPGAIALLGAAELFQIAHE